jgi:1-acyl-sn-glycerol-3-phosphate acyltransferase
MKLHYQHWFKATLIILLFIIGSIISATLLPIFRRLPNRRANLLIPRIQAVWFRTVCYVLGVQFSIQGTPLIGDGLWVSNHISWLDVVILGALQPSAFLAKSEVGNWPVVGFLGRQSGNLFIRRGHGSKQMVETMTQRLRCGDRLVLFPEGTTTRGDTVLRFHGRLLQPAISAGVPVQAVAINYHGKAAELIPFVDDDDFLPHLLRLLHLPQICVTIHFGEPLLIDETVQRNILAHQARSQVLTALGLVDLLPLS